MLKRIHKSASGGLQAAAVVAAAAAAAAATASAGAGIAALHASLDGFKVLLTTSRAGWARRRAYKQSKWHEATELAPVLHGKTLACASQGCRDSEARERSDRCKVRPARRVSVQT